MRLKALTLRYVLNIYIMEFGTLENFLRPRKGPGLNFCRLSPLSIPKSRNFLESEKANFHMLLLKIHENSYKVTSIGVLWLETS